jgi:hypothetical protein
MTMNYAKPEVAVLGEATRVIEEFLIKSRFWVLDIYFPRISINPAYELDE